MIIFTLGMRPLKLKSIRNFSGVTWPQSGRMGLIQFSGLSKPAVALPPANPEVGSPLDQCVSGSGPPQLTFALVCKSLLGVRIS